MKTSSAKAKGRRLSQTLADMLMLAFKSDLVEGDIIVTPSGVNGPDVILSPKAKSLIPFEFESKNCERANLWAFIKQAQSHVAKNGRTPALVVSRNRLPQPWVCIPMDAFIKLLNPEMTDVPANHFENDSVREVQVTPLDV